LIPPQLVLLPMLRKFELRAPLDDLDRQAFLALPFHLRTVEPNVYIIREGDRPDRSCVVVDGFAFRQKVTETGSRQIISIHMPGDYVDIEGALLNIADHSLQALTRCEMAFIPRDAVRDLILSHPKVAMAMCIDTLIDASIFREWVVNVGQREGPARVGHLLCEFGRRLEIAGLGSPQGYQLPMTQEQLGDATGLTPVHVNRVLKKLSDEGFISRTKRNVTIPNWERLRSVAGFNETYLHLDQIARGQRADRSL